MPKETPTEPNLSPADIDMGTGSPDPTIDNLYSTPTATSLSVPSRTDRSDGFSFMEYLFGITSDDTNRSPSHTATNTETQKPTEPIKIEIATEPTRTRLPTTETTYVPEEITAIPTDEYKAETVTEIDIKKLNSTERVKAEEKISESQTSEKAETSSVSSFMDPTNVVSTSLSTEISHETEICFRGKCIKTSKDINL